MLPHQLDLNLLRVFVEVYDARGVSAAGARLHLSQPAISNALGRLRQALDDPLFVRTPRGFMPTAYAEHIVGAVRESLDRLDASLARTPMFEPRQSRRWFRLAMTDAGEMVFVPKLVAALADRAPGVRLQIEPLAFAALAEVLADGTIDAAIGPLPVADAIDLNVTPLFTERYAGLVRRDGALHRASRNRRLGVAALRRAPLVIVVQQATLHRSIALAVAGEGLEPNVVGRVPHFLAVPSLVQGYDALGIMPSEIAAIFEQRGLGVAVRIALPLPPYEVSIARHRRFDRDPGLSWLVALVHELHGRGRAEIG